MCGICGCESDAEEEDARLTYSPGAGNTPGEQEHVRGPDRGQGLGHSNASAEHTGQEETEARTIRLERAVLHKNALLARENRARFRERGLFALNFVSSPGSGKTTLLERTIAGSGLGERLVVIQGDQATDRDAERIRRAGARAVQINTGTGCHLDAAMVARAASELDPKRGSLLAIENVGNLVCPALFDLGEHARVAILSVTEGADKPLKYPYLFRGAHVVLLNKMDLLEHVDFDVPECLAGIRQVNPDARVFQVSARRGDGLLEWFAWLRQGLKTAADTRALPLAPAVRRVAGVRAPEGA
jgi:hydrogenase nickel incorporation protein HypB